MFGCVAELDAASQCAGLRWFEHFVERSFGVRVEVVANQNDLFAVGVTTFQMAGHLLRPVHFRSTLSCGRLTPPRERFGEHEDGSGAGSLILVVDSPSVGFRRRNRLAGFLHQLYGLLVHADHRAIGIVRVFVRFQDVLHVRDKLSIGFRRDDPVLDLAFGHAVFLSVPRTVS